MFFFTWFLELDTHLTKYGKKSESFCNVSHELKQVEV